MCHAISLIGHGIKFHDAPPTVLEQTAGRHPADWSYNSKMLLDLVISLTLI
jgi:hypothetical protein